MLRVSSRLMSLVVLAALVGCTGGATGAASGNGGVVGKGDGEETAIPHDLSAAIDLLETKIGGNDLTGATCSSTLDSAFNKVIELPSDYFVPSASADRKKFVEGLPTQATRLFDLRVTLRHRLSEMQFSSAEQQAKCVASVRRALRAIRHAQELVGDYAVRYAERNANVVPADKAKVFTDRPGLPIEAQAQGQKLSASGDVKLQSGDIFLSRGDAFTSALISRIGDEDGQYSHLALLYIPEGSATAAELSAGTKQAFFIEAHIETGVNVFPWDHYASDGKVRVAVFRHANTDNAAHVAAWMYEQASATHFPYNFPMDLADETRLFCSQVVAYAYLHGSDTPITLPTYETSFAEIADTGFLSSLGVTVLVTFSPNDTDVEPQLELVAEWVDYPRVREAQQLDAIYTAFFDWMVNKGYALDLSDANPAVIAAELAVVVRHFGLLVEKVPPDAPADFVKVGMVTRILTRTLLSRLERADSDQLDKNGTVLTYKQMIDELNRYRQEDYQTWVTYKQNNGGPAPDFHLWYAPQQ